MKNSAIRCITCVDLLLDHAKAKLGTTSDSRLGRVIGARRETISVWRQRRGTPDVIAVEALSRLANESPLYWTLLIQAQKVQAKNPRQASAWMRLAEHLGPDVTATPT
jgi:hypothetical protein